MEFGGGGRENYFSRLENPCNQLLVSFLYLNVVFFPPCHFRTKNFPVTNVPDKVVL